MGKRKRLVILAGAVLLVAAGLVFVDSRSESSAADESNKGALAAVEAFHSALASTDSAAAAAILADDVLIQEGGHIETREEYLSHHLGSDMKFAAQVPSKREVLRAVTLGDVTWIASSTRIEGEFNGQPVLAAGAELMVLSRMNGAWRIRAIHWSSYNKRATG